MRRVVEFGLDDAIRFDHRAFPLELINGFASPRPGTDSEVAAIGRLEHAPIEDLWRCPGTGGGRRSQAFDVVQLIRNAPFRGAVGGGFVEGSGCGWASGAGCRAAGVGRGGGLVEWSGGEYFGQFRGVATRASSIASSRAGSVSPGPR